MSIQDKNAIYIQQLNQNLAVMDQNVQTLSESIKDIARDSMALQQAVIAYMSEKGLIDGPEDARLLQKLHMRHIALLDQQIAQKEAENK